MSLKKVRLARFRAWREIEASPLSPHATGPVRAVTGKHDSPMLELQEFPEVEERHSIEPRNATTIRAVSECPWQQEDHKSPVNSMETDEMCLLTTKTYVFLGVTLQQPPLWGPGAPLLLWPIRPPLTPPRVAVSDVAPNLSARRGRKQGVHLQGLRVQQLQHLQKQPIISSSSSSWSKSIYRGCWEPHVT
ncbi:hypothetical protein ACSSS7_000959 [Eimeria intestinalis]